MTSEQPSEVQKLISEAAEAQEQFGDDELELHAKEIERNRRATALTLVMTGIKVGDKVRWYDLPTIDFCYLEGKVSKIGPWKCGPECWHYHIEVELQVLSPGERIKWQPGFTVYPPVLGGRVEKLEKHDERTEVTNTEEARSTSVPQKAHERPSALTPTTQSPNTGSEAPESGN